MIKQVKLVALLAHFCAVTYGANNSAGYGESLSHSGDYWEFPRWLTYSLIGVFSLGLTTTMGFGKYADDNKVVIANWLGINPEEVAQLLNPVADGGGDASETTSVKPQSLVIKTAEKIGSIGKAIISNASMYRLVEAEVARLSTWADIHTWLAYVSLVPAVPATVFSQYAVLKKDATQVSVMKNALVWTCAHLVAPANIARLANVPGTAMYFDTARKLMKKAGWLSADYAPIWPIAVLGVFSTMLYIAGNVKFQKEIERVADTREDQKVKTWEAKLMKVSYVGRGMEWGSALLKSFTGELALLLALDDLGAPPYAFYSALVVTSLPLFVTMWSYFTAKQEGVTSPSAASPAAAQV